MQELSRKQQEVLESIANEDPIVLVLTGAKRAGKTFILNLIYLSHIANFEGTGHSFILGGTTYSSIRRNVLNDWEQLLGMELKLTKDSALHIFGCKVYVLPGGDASSYKKVRGFTSYGAMLNEATTLDNTYIKECFSRCSGEGARIYMDTNPENPTHTVKTDYIDKDGDTLDGGRLNIRAFHFTLYDNEFLSKEYVQSIIRTTPAGMFTDRDIYGRWVSPEGVVYQDFNINTHVINQKVIEEENIQFINYFAGVDWGYQHKGSIVVIGQSKDNKFYLLEEHTAQYKEIDWWVEIGKSIKAKYGHIFFFCDSARPEYVARFSREGLRAINANKKVLTGIEVVSKLIKTDRFYLIKEAINQITNEFNLYIWDDKTGSPVKTNDDVMDALRYAIYSYYLKNPKVFNF